MNLDIVLYTEGPEFKGDAVEIGPLGGSETAFISLSRGLVASGHRVSAYCRCPRPGVYSGVMFADISDFERVARLRSSRRPVHLLAVGFRCSTVRRRRGSSHSGTTIRSATSIATRIRARRCRTSPDTYRLSDFHRDTFAAVTEVPTSTIRKTFNGIDLALIEPIRQAAGKRHRMMYISRPERGLMQALDIYEQLGDPTLEFVAATYPYTGTQRDQEIERECSARVAELPRCRSPDRDRPVHQDRSCTAGWPTASS